MLFDTHCHFDDDKFENDRDFVIRDLINHGVNKAVTIGTDIQTSKFCIKLAEKYDNLYASVGIHPEFADSLTDDTLSVLEELAKNEKVVAIGETGLDYYWDENPPRDVQKYAFIKQIELSNKLGLPLVIHNRESTSDLVEILKKHTPKKAIIHCISVSKEVAEIFIKMGFYISFAGTVTFKNAPKLREVAKIVPDELLLIETDSPYLSPEPVRGTRNDSRNIKYTAQKLAEIRNTTFKEIENITYNNALKIYNKIK